MKGVKFLIYWLLVLCLILALIFLGLSLGRMKAVYNKTISSYE